MTCARDDGARDDGARDDGVRDDGGGARDDGNCATHARFQRKNRSAGARRRVQWRRCAPPRLRASHSRNFPHEVPRSHRPAAARRHLGRELPVPAPRGARFRADSADRSARRRRRGWCCCRCSRGAAPSRSCARTPFRCCSSEPSIPRMPFVLLAYGLLHITTGVAAILNAMVPLWAALIGWAWLRDRLALDAMARTAARRPRCRRPGVGTREPEARQCRVRSDARDRRLPGRDGLLRTGGDPDQAAAGRRECLGHRGRQPGRCDIGAPALRRSSAGPRKCPARCPGRQRSRSG